MVETDIQAQKTLMVLLRRGLGFSAGEALPCAEGVDWNAVLGIARRQAVTGILYAGLQTVEEPLPIPEDTLFLLVALISRIEKKGKALDAFSARFTASLREEGWHPLVLKGPEVARLYPSELLRESGDLDLWLPEDEWNRFEAARPLWKKAPDGSLQWVADGVPVDLHRRYFDLSCRKRFLPEVPSSEATLLMLSAHIRKHCMGSGVGLKQICDMAVAYSRLPYDREKLKDIYKNTGTLRWNRLLAAFLEAYLHCRDHPFLPGELPSPQPLASIVFSGGDQGQYAPGRTESLRSSSGRRKWDTFRRMARRVPFSLRYAPGELLPYLGTLLRNQ